MLPVATAVMETVEQNTYVRNIFPRLSSRFQWFSADGFLLERNSFGIKGFQSAGKSCSEKDYPRFHSHASWKKLVHRVLVFSTTLLYPPAPVAFSDDRPSVGVDDNGAIPDDGSASFLKSPSPNPFVGSGAVDFFDGLPEGSLGLSPDFLSENTLSPVCLRRFSHSRIFLRIFSTCSRVSTFDLRDRGVF